MLATSIQIVDSSSLSITDQMSQKQIDFKNESLTGFINHPKRFPLHYKRLRFWEKSKLEFGHQANIGLTFSSEKYEKPGNILEITIPTKKETYQFSAKVVAVKQTETGYELGVWLLNAEDAPKLRIIEKICHIEIYLNEKKYREGPFLSQEKVTEEWIGKFASQFSVN